ncbi:GrpB family protein [Pelagibacterium halotolerans]|uniref:GrpB family protein n=1 Tax=Pelagibacterium halotolerans TaxID=531813 RepID=UPI00384C198A
MNTIEIVPPSSSWPDDFAALKAVLLGAVPDRSVFHHIGSTAVPGLAAKDVIDIQISVDALDRIDPARLEGLGFRHIAARLDHCPPGMEMPADDLAKLFFRGAARPAHIHIREKGRFNQRYALLCRDFLRSHKVAADAYALIKRRLAERFATDVDAYYDIKDPVFDIIVEGANEWAMRIGWTEPPGD